MNDKASIEVFQDNGDDRPLPMIVADRWGFPLGVIRREDNGETIYSARDWYIGLGGDKTGWNKDKNDWLISTQPVNIEVKRVRRAPETIPFINAAGLYRIAQDMRVMKKRPQLKEIRDYLIAAGVIVDRMRRDPEYAQQVVDELTERHNLVREKGKAKRNLLTEAAQNTHVTHTPNYAALTNTEYQELFGAAKDELVKALNLTPAQARQFRDYVSDLALTALDMAETGATIRMKQLRRLLSTNEQIEIVRESARLVAPSAKAMAEFLQVDLLSGKSLLSSGE